MLKKCQESTFTDLDSSEKLDMLTEEGIFLFGLYSYFIEKYLS